MSQIYWNEPSTGYAMTAEEFAARAAERLPGNPGTSQCPGLQPCPPQVNGCGCGCGSVPSPMPPMTPGCGGAASDCPDNGCGQPMICCCRPAPTPAPQPPQVDEGCCCKQSFRAALSLLCDQQISSLLDFDLSAFLTNTYSAGATLEAAAGGGAGTPPATPGTGGADPNAAPGGGPTTRAVVPSVTPTDNLADTLTGSFRRFAPSSYDLIDVDAPVYDAAGTEVFTATQVSLCQLDAVVIQGAAATAEGDLTAEEVAARNFRCVRTRLAQRLNPCGSPCGQNQCSCACDSGDCCCAAGLLATLAQNNLSRRVSLVAGLLVLNAVTLLGTVGNVLVLANDADNRLYFVCVNSVQFIG